jgi:iron(III) transport system permease protein
VAMRSRALADRPLFVAPWLSDGSFWLRAVCVAAVLALVLVPIAFLLWQSVTPPLRPPTASAFTLEHFETALARMGSTRMLANTLAFASGAAAIALATGTLLAWLVERTDAPLRRIAFALALVPLVIPGVLFAAGWMLIGSPQIGLANLALRSLLATDAVYVNVYTLAGMIVVEGLHYSPLAFLLMSVAFRAMDPSLEDVAALSGAHPLAVALRVTLPLAWPAMLATLLFVFVRAIESFEVPALLGLPAGIAVFTTAIYEAAYRDPGSLGLASAYGTIVLAIALAGLYAQSKLSRGEHRYATVTGRRAAAPLLRLGRWRPVVGAGLILHLSLVALLPIAALLWSSLHPFYRAPSMESVTALSLDAYRRVLRHPALPGAVANSVALALAAATIVTTLGALVAWCVVRLRWRGQRFLEVAASLPVAVPGLVLGLALMVVHLSIPSAIYGTLAILLVAYTTRFLPYGVRYGTLSLLKVHPELEQSATLCGAGSIATLRRIVMPLIRPGLIAGWLYVAILSVRELGSSILLYSPGTEVVAVVLWELWENGQHGELAALGVLFVLALVALVIAAQAFGIRRGPALP